jgi:C-terminal processing protease CtpA/Prc
LGVLLIPKLAAETTRPLSPEASGYLKRALDVLEYSSINRQKIEWPAFRQRVIERAAGAQTTADTYPAIRYALEELNDQHSLFLTPAAKAEWVAPITTPAPTRPPDLTPNQPAPPPPPPAIPWPHGETVDHVAYVTVPGFISGNEEASVAFATSIQTLLQKLESSRPKGWIVDLRENTGGNMWPMLVGLGPLVGDGEVGSVMAPYGIKTPWWYREGSGGTGKSAPALSLLTAIHLARGAAPVALLLGPQTASSGEAIAVSFLGRPATRSFGAATNGRSSANDKFPLSDGAVIFLTIGVFADRSGKTYGGQIAPDEPIAPASKPSAEIAADPVVRAALDWLKTVSP